MKASTLTRLASRLDSSRPTLPARLPTSPRIIAVLMLMLVGQAAMANPGSAGQNSTAKGAIFSIEHSSIDGGVGSSSAGNYAIRGTSGQPDADPLGSASGGIYSVIGGVWPTGTVPDQSDALHADGFE